MARIFKSIRETIKIPTASQERFLPLSASYSRALRDIHVTISGLSELTKGYLVERQRVDFHLVLYTLSGMGALTLDGTEQPLAPSSLLVAPAGTTYRYVTLEAPWRILWFHLLDRAPWRAQSLDDVRVRPAYQAQALERAAEGLLLESRGAEGAAARMAELYAEQVTLLLLRELATDESSRLREKRARLDRLWDVVDARLDEPWNVQRLAALVEMSAPALHRESLRHCGLSPMQMVYRLRMQRAEQLLAHTTQPLQAIADQTGYASAFALSTAFKRHTGQSPQHFREGGKNTD